MRPATSARRPALPVSPDYGPTGNEFNGQVNWVQIDLEKDDNDHLISPDERFRIAMARSSRHPSDSPDVELRGHRSAELGVLSWCERLSSSGSSVRGDAWAVVRRGSFSGRC